jgi:hypothetical protein
MTTGESQASQESGTQVYDPTGVEATGKQIVFASRPANLKNKKIGLFWNSKANGDFFLNRVAEMLAQKFPGVQVLKYWELDPVNTGHPDKKSDTALDYMAQNADLVIAAQGD